jgi:hypothetical protein
MLHKFLLKHREKGQGMTELAFMAPILIILIVGGIEAGWVLRSYLIVNNVNRELTRIAVRPNYLDFSQRDASTVGYETVADQADDAASDQLAIDLSEGGNATLIIHHVVINTGFPAPPDQIADCDPESYTADNPNGSLPYTADDDVRTPETAGYEYFLEVYPEGSTVTSFVNYDEILPALIAENNALNCKLLSVDSSAEPSVDNFIITELFYHHKQLLGLFGSLGDVDLHAQSQMRIPEGHNQGAIGPTCAVMPVTFDQAIFPDPDNPPSPYALDIFEGDGEGSFGWLYWDPDNRDTHGTNTIEEELSNPLMSLTAFEDAREPGDTLLNIGDHVDSATGVKNSAEVDRLLQTYVGKIVIVPVYDTTDATGTNNAYHVSHFARVLVNSICLPRNGQDCNTTGQAKRINATFLEYADDACVDPVEQGEQH